MITATASAISDQARQYQQTSSTSHPVCAIADHTRRSGTCRVAGVRVLSVITLRNLSQRAATVVVPVRSMAVSKRRTSQVKMTLTVSSKHRRPESTWGYSVDSRAGRSYTVLSKTPTPQRSLVPTKGD
jgi:FlaA1/EpsC-like NDP-sugar epimerase